MRGNSNRFYISEAVLAKAKTSLGDEWLEITDRQLIKQWLKVMRFGEGDVVRLFDGSGHEYNYQFLIINDQSKFKDQDSKIKLRLVDKKYCPEKKCKIYIGFGILKDRTRLEWMMEKCTELGVDGFVPVMADNCQVKDLKRTDRLEKKMIEASEQCGRVRLPEILTNHSMEEVLDNPKWRVVVMEKGQNKAEIKIEDSNGSRDILLLVGPEGGWSQREIKLFNQSGVRYMSLSDNVLRAETAAIIGTSDLYGKLRNLKSNR